MTAIPRIIGTIDGKPVEMDMEFTLLLNELLNGQSAVSLGTITSGVAQAQAAADAAAAAAALAQSEAGTATAVASAAQSEAGTATAAVAAVAESQSNPFGLTASPTTVSGSRIGAGSVTTNTVTIAISGGTGPFTQAWTKVSGSTIAPTAPTALTTAFSATVNVGDVLTGFYKCAVTDTSDSSVASLTVFVSVSETS